MGTVASGQELEPRTYANTAIGVNLIGAAAGFSRGNILLDPALPIENLDGDVKYGAIQYLRSFGLFQRSAKVKLMVPFTTGDWEGTLEGEPGSRSATGFGDARLTLEWNFIGAPAMTVQELRNFEQKTVVGASVRVIAPTGDYDSTELINLGSNRWSYRFELGASRAFGNWGIEGIGAVWKFGNNDDFVDGNYLQQD
ncbi:MAG: transporter, partial [Gammaproteobacteria bacterium]